ncbi:KdsC family phosphatase [Bacillus sp. USDA818B3_A]|uniref:KdsC family phosphatase n=1 Tax=Bacillus sp. USDA818B3_A TaxID=2698834 RepID=UPI00136F84B9|nr:HAD hydrolase family protein [Bacillus sp. USDA818B3_A]
MSIPEIKLIVLDVDGVLTDGKLLIGSNGVEYKSFNVKDGLGIGLAKFCGLKVAIITGRDSESVQIRSKELKIDCVYQGITNKVEVLDKITASLGIQYNNVFYMGDDINDLPIIRIVGFSAAPNDSAELVKETVNFVSSLNGGMGAVREAIDFILSHQVDYKELIKNYLCKKTDLIQ